MWCGAERIEQVVMRRREGHTLLRNVIRAGTLQYEGGVDGGRACIVRRTGCCDDGNALRFKFVPASVEESVT